MSSIEQLNLKSNEAINSLRLIKLLHHVSEMFVEYHFHKWNSAEPDPAVEHIRDAAQYNEHITT